MRDTIELTVAFVLFIGGALYAHLKYWAWFFAGLAALLGIAELVCYRKTGLTLSDMFRDYSQKHKKRAWTVLICWTLGWLTIAAHLASRIL